MRINERAQIFFFFVAFFIDNFIRRKSRIFQMTEDCLVCYIKKVFVL